MRHDIDPRAIAAQMLGATMGEDISAQLGDSVADQATAAALSTASSAVLGSAITHTPLDAENLAETMLGTAIGTSIGAKFAPKPGEDLLGNKHTTKHVPSLTKQAHTQQKQQRSATAAEKKHDDLHQPSKPKGPKHKLYDPNNDPEILKAEAVANMSVPGADLAHQLSAARAPWHPGLFNKKTLLNQVIDAKTFAPYQGHAREDALWAGVDYINAVGEGVGYVIQHPMNAVRGLGVLGNETYRYLSSHGIDVESDHFFHTMGDNISATLSAAMNYDPRAIGTLISIPFGAGLGSRLGHVTNLNEMAASAALKGTEYTAKAVKLAGAHTARAAKAVMQQSARIGKSAARFFEGRKLERTWGSFEIDRSLPRTKHGDPLPDVNRPHTQLGKRGKGGYEYKQAREWGYDDNGQLVPKRDIDFTDHGMPEVHPNPHQHDLYKDSQGGGYKRGEPKPLSDFESIYRYRNN